MTIYVIDTIRDFQALPLELQLAIRQTSFNPHGKRWVAEMRKAERKTAIQRAVQRAIVNGHIGETLGIEILKTNKAFGRDGKEAISAAKLGKLPQ